MAVVFPTSECPLLHIPDANISAESESQEFAWACIQPKLGELFLILTSRGDFYALFKNRRLVLIILSFDFIKSI